MCMPFVSIEEYINNRLYIYFIFINTLLSTYKTCGYKLSSKTEVKIRQSMHSTEAVSMQKDSMPLTECQMKPCKRTEDRGLLGVALPLSTNSKQTGRSDPNHAFDFPGRPTLPLC
jgi:hypothetical protein